MDSTAGSRRGCRARLRRTMRLLWRSQCGMWWNRYGWGEPRCRGCLALGNTGRAAPGVRGGGSKEGVWMRGYSRGGVDPYSTFSKLKNVCAGDAPVMFLSSEGLADVMGQYADVIELGVFGHTHMDEMRLFGREGVGAGG